LKRHIHAPSAATLLILTSICLAQADQGKTQPRSAKPRAARPTGAIANKLVGTWKLVSIHDHNPNSPYREYNPTGYIIYGSTGKMAVQITRRSDRARFAEQEIAKATTDEKAAAFDSYAAYYGTYTINETAGTITHHLEGSLNPNEVGKDLVRYFKLAGNRVTLIPVETNDGRPASSPPTRSLTWERVK